MQTQILHCVQDDTSFGVVGLERTLLVLRQ